MIYRVRFLLGGSQLGNDKIVYEGYCESADEELGLIIGKATAYALIVQGYDIDFCDYWVNEDFVDRLWFS